MSDQSKLTQAQAALASARALFAKADYNGAVAQAIEAMNAFAAAQADGSSDSLICHKLLGDAYFAQQKFKEAQNAFQKGLTQAEKQATPDWPKIVEAHYDVVRCDFRLNRLGKVEQQLSRAADLAKKHLPGDHQLHAKIKDTATVLKSVLNPDSVQPSFTTSPKSPTQSQAAPKDVWAPPAAKKATESKAPSAPKYAVDEPIPEPDYDYGIDPEEEEKPAAKGPAGSTPYTRPNTADSGGSQVDSGTNIRPLIGKRATAEFKGTPGAPLPPASLLDSPLLDGSAEKSPEERQAAQVHTAKLRKSETAEQRKPVQEALKESMTGIGPKLFGQGKGVVPVVIVVILLIGCSSLFKKLGMISDVNPYLSTDTVVEQRYYTGMYPLQVNPDTNRIYFCRTLPLQPGDRSMQAIGDSWVDKDHKEQLMARDLEFVPLFNFVTEFRSVLSKNTYWLVCKSNHLMVDDNGLEYYAKEDDHFALMEALQNFSAAALDFRYKFHSFPDLLSQGKPEDSALGCLSLTNYNPISGALDLPSLKVYHNIAVEKVAPEKQLEALEAGALWKGCKLKPGKIECLRFFPKTGGEYFFVHIGDADAKPLSNKQGVLLFAFTGVTQIKPSQDLPIEPIQNLVVISPLPKSEIVAHALSLLIIPGIVLIMIVAMIIRNIIRKNRNQTLV